MIHVLTVHWLDDRWIDVQLKYLNQNIKEPYKVYAFLNAVPGDHRSKFFYSSTEKIQPHAIKLNLLADMAILNSTSDDDWLMFIDGDAFPIGDVVAFGQRELNEHPLLAIQRIENAGDIQPHPSFCLTTVKFWKDIKGDWNPGYKWKDSTGNKVTDVGGNLLSMLEKEQVDWLPLLRSNKRDMHKLWFGIYGGLIYHHGAGFRKVISRLDEQFNALSYIPSLNRLLGKCYRKVALKRIIQNNTILSEKVFQSILNDPAFYSSFQDPE